MEKEKLVLYLQHTGIVSLENARQIAACFTEQTIVKNRLFLKEGRISNEYFFLETGFMRAFAFDTDGNEVTTGFYAANTVVFEVASFFNRTISKENIQALTDCTGWSITFNQLNDLFHSMPAFREFGRSVLVKGFSSLKTRMLSLITETAEERYEKLVNSNPEIFQYAPLKNIASYLGITDSSLSRIRKEFSKK
ncbi:MAG: Crp/Fnr family transcriptional regulator [Chitinophagaceae bacterium]